MLGILVALKTAEFGENCGLTYDSLRRRMNFEIPPGLTDLLQEFTVAVLRQKPTDLVEFAALYFNERYERLGGGKDGKGVRFSGDDALQGSESSDDDIDEADGKGPLHD